MTSKTNSETTSTIYFEKLLAQGQDNLNICPSCFRDGERMKYCRNMVLIMPEKHLCCCYLGDKHQISPSEFNKKIREMKERFQ